jgi:hypothetical protein
MGLQLRTSDNVLGPGGHLAELRMRRLRVGELSVADAGAAKQHLDECAACRLRLEGLESEERAFSQAIAYPRFAGGVERAARVPRPEHRPGRRSVIYAAALGCAAAAAFLLVFRQGGDGGTDGPGLYGGPENRTKGGASVDVSVRVASGDGRAQRSAAPGSTTPLAPGERLRIGYFVPGTRYLLAVTIDDAGTMSPVFDEGGDSHLVAATKAMTFLPDSIELTGAGHERLFLFVSQTPFPGAVVQAALREALNKARGDLAAMESPRVSADMTGHSWLFRKP